MLENISASSVLLIMECILERKKGSGRPLTVDQEALCKAFESDLGLPLSSCLQTLVPKNL